MATAWQMPGMLPPCWQLRGDMSAPVAATSTRFQVPFAMPFSIWPQSTEAQQPQPEPPQWTSWVFRS